MHDVRDERGGIQRRRRSLRIIINVGESRLHGFNRLSGRPVSQYNCLYALWRLPDKLGKSNCAADRVSDPQRREKRCHRFSRVPWGGQKERRPVGRTNMRKKRKNNVSLSSTDLLYKSSPEHDVPAVDDEVDARVDDDEQVVDGDHVARPRGELLPPTVQQVEHLVHAQEDLPRVADHVHHDDADQEPRDHAVATTSVRGMKGNAILYIGSQIVRELVCAAVAKTVG